jgi:hypothetical protein
MVIVRDISANAIAEIKTINRGLKILFEGLALVIESDTLYHDGTRKNFSINIGHCQDGSWSMPSGGGTYFLIKQNNMQIYLCILLGSKVVFSWIIKGASWRGSNVISH